MKWTEKMAVDAHETDAFHAARPAAILRYMQSAANLQLYHCGPSTETLLSLGQAFVVSRMAVTFHMPVTSYDKLDVSTWSADTSRGYSFIRCYSVRHGDHLVAEATSVWALTDIRTHKLIRYNDYHCGYENDPAISVSAPLRFPMPESLDDIGTYTVLYRDIDQNHHMNNVRYLDLITDNLDMRRYTVKEASIVYVNEAPEYSRVRITRKIEDDVAFFRTFREDGKINIEARVKLAVRSL